MPKKSVTLPLEDYNKLLEITALAVKINDKYVVDAHSEMKESSAHIMDTDKADPDQKALYSKLLYLPDDITPDVVDNLSRDYVHPPGSVWYAHEYEL
jgi:hypothetical protein